MIASLGERTLQAIESLPAHLAFHCINLRSERPAQARQVRPAPASTVESTIVRGLETGGLSVVGLSDLGLTGAADMAMLASGRRVADRLASRIASSRPSSTRRRGTLLAEPEELMRHPEIYRWGLHPVLLRIAETYLGAPVAYDGPIVTLSPPDGTEIGLRSWHLDREDRRMIKLALYLNDVDEDGGPFQLLKSPDHGERRIPAYASLTTPELYRRLGYVPAADRIVSCTGKAGTLVFADTARFLHRGKPPTLRARSAIFFSYFRRSTRHPFYTQRCRLTRPQIGALVKELTPEQQACALWRDGVRGLVRFVPPSRQ